MSDVSFLKTPLILISDVLDLGIFIGTSSAAFLFCNGFVLSFACFLMVSVRVGLVDFEVGLVYADIYVDVGLVGCSFNSSSEDTTSKKVFE